METIEITNFGGRLTRILNGDLNSGMAKFVQSFGYDPFSKPQNLTWFETPKDITGAITDLVVGAKPYFNGSAQTIFMVGHTGKFYQINPASISNPNLDSIIGISSVTAGVNTYTFGGSIEFFGSPEKIYVGGDSAVNSITGPGNFDGSGDTRVGVAGNYLSNKYRPLKQFLGKLYYGNGDNVGAIDSTGTVVSSVASDGVLNPQLPPETYITDLDLSPDGNYLLITTSTLRNEQISNVSSDRQAASSGEGNLYRWNGIDVGITASNTIPSYAVTALQTYLNNYIFFSNDSFGASLNDGTNKLLTLPQNKSPFANSIGVNGNFIFWICPEISADGTKMNASMYYYGSLDQENPPGLFRVLRYSTALSSGFTYQTPVNLLTNNKYTTVNNAITATAIFGYGKHYFSVYDRNASTDSFKLFSFLVTPTGTGTAQLGVYETQTQLFSKKVTIKQIRVYTEPTVANNGFQIDCIGSDGNVITNGTFTYTFSAGTDSLTLQGALDRIDFNPAMKSTYALGLRITNTGTANMTFKKIEVDWEYSGK